MSSHSQPSRLFTMYNLTYFRNTTAHLLSVLVLFFVGTASAHAADPVPSLKSPFLFVENAGQVVDADGALQPDVLYVLEQGDMTVFVRSNGLSYQFTHSEYTDGTDGTPIPKYTRFLRTKYESHRVDLQLVNASTDARVTREQLSEYFEQFFLPQCQAGVKAATCERLVVHDVYPNIDWVLYLKDGGLKYDFVVRAGGDPAVIAMHYTYMDDLALDPAGDLTITTKLGTVKDSRPTVVANGLDLAARFVQNAAGDVAFAIDGFTPGTSCVIDPSVLWAGYYGTSGMEWGGSDVVVDASGNVFMCGTTDAAGSVLNFGGYFTSYQGGAADWYIVKWGPNGGTVPLWGTYYGASGNDGNFSFGDSDMDGHMAILGSGPNAALYFVGTTSSTSAGAPFATLNTGAGACASSHAFIIKFLLTGAFQWSRFWGGSVPCGLGDFGCGIAVDPAGTNVYITGATMHTNSLQNPIGINISGGLSDGFLLRLNNAGTPIWDRYMGDGANAANGEDVGSAIQVGADRNVVIGGYTRSTAGIALNPWQAALSGPQDGWLSKYHATTAVTIWSTYYGGPDAGNYDHVRDIALDVKSNIYAVGNTASPSGIASCAQQIIQAGGQDAFLAKFNKNGMRTWGTYCGGTGNEWGFAVCVDALGYPFITGQTSSSGMFLNGLTNYNALNFTTVNGWGDAMLARYTHTGQLMWRSYYGGTGTDVGRGIAYDASSGSIYMSGYSTATGLATTVPPQWPFTPGALLDGLLAKIGPSSNTLGTLKLKPNALLGGAFPLGAGCVMTDALPSCPIAQPYTNLGFPHTGSEVTTAAVLATVGSNAIVDWVLLELRHATDNCLIVVRAPRSSRFQGPSLMWMAFHRWCSMLLPAATKWPFVTAIIWAS
ncbi:MAG: hypothetical protein IPO17_04435 [Flavobacteriales bacterium]|nr:hypothetical protein [Flavobacteriales bacterium]